MTHTFTYTDDGNHQVWTPSHQGGSYSRVSRTQRFFVGSDQVFAAIGGDTFRQDSHIGYNNTFAVGTQIQDLGDVVDRVSTVGIVEDEDNGFGRYFFLRYEYNGLKQVPVALAVYDSAYADEMNASSVSDAWQPLVTIRDFSEVSMRVLNISGVGTFLFYLVRISSSQTRLNMVKLPDPGQPSNSNAPFTITTFGFEALDRMYVVERSGNALIFVGNTEREQTHNTTVLEYDPVNHVVTQPPIVIATDAMPFPRSYAACVGRTVYGEAAFHLVLEPTRSWTQGAASSIDDDANELDSTPPSFRRVTGSSWTLASVRSSGRSIEDSVVFDGEDLRPWMGTANADSQGGQVRVSACPKMLSRIAPPPASFAAYGTVPLHDSSDSYVVQTQVEVRQEGILENPSFVYRKDKVAELKPSFGNNRSTSNVFDESPPVLADGGSFDGRKRTSLLVPGTILIESIRVESFDSIPEARTVSPVANRLRSWGLEDVSVFYGAPAGYIVGDYAEVGPTSQDQSTDCIHGVQGDIFDPDLTVIVGWFTNGFLYPS